MHLPLPSRAPDDGAAPDDEAGPRPHVPYARLWVDAEGISRQAISALTEWELKGVGAAAPRWNHEGATVASTGVFTTRPTGWVGEWLEDPAPQWIAVLSGRWFIESMDGTRIEQGAGEFSFGEDQGCVEPNGRKGHRSGTVGDQPAVLMTVQLHRAPSMRPCSLR